MRIIARNACRVWCRGGLSASVLPAVILPAVAQQTATLPGGPSSVTETHGDWTVRCNGIRQSGSVFKRLVQMIREQGGAPF